MTHAQIQRWITHMESRGWHLATHATILDRRHSAHRHIGSLHFMRPLADKRFSVQGRVRYLDRMLRESEVLSHG